MAGKVGSSCQDPVAKHLLWMQGQAHPSPMGCAASRVDQAHRFIMEEKVVQTGARKMNIDKPATTVWSTTAFKLARTEATVRS